MRVMRVLTAFFGCLATTLGMASDLHPELVFTYTSIRQDVKDEPLVEEGKVESLAVRPGILLFERMGLTDLELSAKGATGSHLGKAHKGFRGGDARFALNYQGRDAQQQMALSYRESQDDLGLIGTTLEEQYTNRFLVGRARDSERVHAFSHFMQWSFTPRWVLETGLSAQSLDRVKFTKSSSLDLRVRHLVSGRFSVGAGASGDKICI